MKLEVGMYVRTIGGIKRFIKETNNDYKKLMKINKMHIKNNKKYIYIKISKKVLLYKEKIDI